VSRRRDQRLADVVIELDDPAELFAVDARGLLDGSRRIDSGIDELIERLLAQRRLRSDQSIVLDIAGGCPDELAANLVESVRRYGEMAVRRANRQRDLIWRQGMRSLVSGSLLFGTGIALSYLFTRPMVGEFAGDLFGNGVFLVVAWVGLWYPIDVLFIAREQAKREARVLHLSDDQHDLHVRPGGGGTARAKPDVLRRTSNNRRRMWRSCISTSIRRPTSAWRCHTRWSTTRVLSRLSRYSSRCLPPATTSERTIAPVSQRRKALRR